MLPRAVVKAGPDVSALDDARDGEEQRGWLAAKERDDQVAWGVNVEAVDGRTGDRWV